MYSVVIQAYPRQVVQNLPPQGSSKQLPKNPRVRHQSGMGEWGLLEYRQLPQAFLAIVLPLKLGLA